MAKKDKKDRPAPVLLDLTTALQANDMHGGEGYLFDQINELKDPPKFRKLTSYKKVEDRKKELLRALEYTLGIISSACRLVQCERQTFYNYMQDDNFKTAYEEINDLAVDFSERQMFRQIKGLVLPETKFFNIDGKIVKIDTVKLYPPSDTLIIWHTKNKGRLRGYTDKSEIELPTVFDKVTFNYVEGGKEPETLGGDLKKKKAAAPAKKKK